MKYNFHRAANVWRWVLMVVLIHLCNLDIWCQNESDEGGFKYKEIAMDFNVLTIEDGLSQGMVNAITQDEYGFIWIGTKDGLNRYDGYGFKIFRNIPDDLKSIGSNFILLLLTDSKGRVWIGHSKGLDVYNHRTETFEHINLNIPAGYGGGISKIIEDHNGDVWIGFTEGLAKLTFTSDVGKSVEQDALPKYHVRWLSNTNTRMGVDQDGRIWGDLGDGLGFTTMPQHMGDEVFEKTLRWKSTLNEIIPKVKELVVIQDTVRNKLFGIYQSGILEIDRQTGEAIELYAMAHNEGTLTNNNAGIDQEGLLWIPTYSGLFRFNPVTREMVRSKPEDPRFQSQGENVKSVYFDQFGLMWIGTSGYGLMTFDPRVNRFHRVTDNSIIGLQNGPGNTLITSKYQTFLNVFDPRQMRYTLSYEDMYDLPANFSFLDYDSDGNLKSENGKRAYQVLLDQISRGKTYSALQSSFALQDEQGNFWISNYDLFSYNPTAMVLERYSARFANGKSDGSRFPLCYASNGMIWSGGDSALWKFDSATKKFSPYPFPIKTTSNPYPFVTSIIEGKDGIIWVGTLRGLLKLDPSSGKWVQYKNDPVNPNSLTMDVVFSIAEDPKEPSRYLWIGTNGGGLDKMEIASGVFTHFTTGDGLPNDVVYGVLSDDYGNVWMSTNKGIARLNTATGAIRSFTEVDGLQSDEFNRYAYCKGADGTLYFGGVNGFNFFAPASMVEDTIPVKVQITDIRLLNKSIAFGKDEMLSAPAFMSDRLEIPHHLNVITFYFASMEYSAPEKHRYQYKLEGFDADWIDAGTRHFANYTNLNPGTYTFHVRGDNADGIWNRNATQFTLVVLPPWWRTWWFYSLCFIIVVGSVLLYIISLRRQKRKLERTVVQRTAEVRNERDKNDALLNNILPAEISEVLKKKGKVDTRYFDEATILISDFKSFTEMSQNLSPAQLVDELNVCFKEFDRIMEKYGIEKIKTIGDAYLAAGGVPDPNYGPPLGVVYAALEMQAFMLNRNAQLQLEGRQAFEMRVGVHTGPVVAGVVGKQKFQYDLWGSSLGVADALENASPIGGVLISEVTYRKVKLAIDLEFSDGPSLGLPDQPDARTFLVRRKAK